MIDPQQTCSQILGQIRDEMMSKMVLSGSIVIMIGGVETTYQIVPAGFPVDNASKLEQKFDRNLTIEIAISPVVESEVLSDQPSQKLR